MSAPSVAIVGAGFGGIGTAVSLLRAGVEDMVVLERGERVGGVWNQNTYPGAACDVPSHLYSYSFARNSRWGRRFAMQAEIQRYVEDVARTHGVLEHVRLGTDVSSATWDAGAGRDPTNWPGYTFEYRRRTARVAPDVYALSGASRRSSSSGRRTRRRAGRRRPPVAS